MDGVSLKDVYITGMDELMSTINQFVRERGPAVSNAFPEQYPIALCGYYKVVSL